MKIDHIGIAVKSLEEGLTFYKKLFPKCEFEEIERIDLGQKMVMIRGTNVKIELISPLISDSIINRFIEKKGEGIHHIAFQVDSIKEKMSEAKALGFHLVTEEPYKGAEGFDICFIHPRDTSGVLVELCQSDK